MPTPVKTSFLDRLVATRLLTEQQIVEALEAVAGDESELGNYLVRKELLTPFQVRQIRAGASGFHVGKYVVLDCLGRGGNGVVFKARHTIMTQRIVALKTVDTRSLHHDSAAQNRFQLEIDILSRLEHPNIVRAYDVLQTRTNWFLVLEYIAGRDLATLVQDRGPLPIGEAVDYAVQAARGLAFAHRAGVIHRDLKPANLLVTADDVVKLSDLGLALLNRDQADDNLTLQGMCVGTPEFMAPEQAEDSRLADARSDIFSLGATLFHLLTGELHVKGKSYMHRLKQLLLVPPRPLAEARPDVPAGLAVIVDGLRARDPKLRPATAEEVVALLKPYARKKGTGSSPRMDGKSRVALIVDVLQGRLSVADACQVHDLQPGELDEWRQRFLEGAEQALVSDEQSSSPAELMRELHAQIGEQAMEIQMLRRQLSSVK